MLQAHPQYTPVHDFASMLHDSPNNGPVGLAGPDEALGSQFGSYLNGLSDQMAQIVSVLDETYGGMKAQMSELGIPLISDASAEALTGMPTTWTQALDDKYNTLRAMAIEATRFLDEGANGQRVVALDGKVGWAIASREGDAFAIDYDKANRELFMRPVPKAEPASVQGLGEPITLAVLALAALGTAIALAQLYVLYIAVSGIIELIRTLIQLWTTKTVLGCLDKHSVGECERAGKALEGINKSNDKPTDSERQMRALTDLIATVSFVAAGGAAFYLIGKYALPMLSKTPTDK